MASEKVTVMILNVDLKCPCCYKKVKKVLCKFPQIRDQVFDEDKNKVRITVVCCNPEKIRDKLCCKGGKAIQSIEIVENKPKPPEKPKPVEKPKPPEPEKPKVIEKKPEPKPPPVVVPVPVEKPKVDPPKPDPPKPDPPKEDPPKKPDPAPTPKPPVVVPQPEPVKMPEPMHGYPQPFCPPQFPVSVCCQECYEGRGGGPCHYGYGRPVPPPPGPCYDGYGYQYGGNRPCYARCDYFSEENPQGCSVM
ncbi:unnamed protein product [Lactuca saligna]|uniref:HMA domain-containing protein n=1 Tax=Lactuca saligna TaxID=75948 RepID=A0AA35ZHS1_LACSI|nr:unnamed protein product [Lactuca saligna]